MKNNKEAQLKKLQNVKLSKDEKRDLKQVIDAHVRIQDVRDEDASRQYGYKRSSFVLSVLTKQKYYMTGLAIGLMLVIGGGTSFAAQGALPGDTLYPVKVGVNERVEGAFAIGAENQAEFESERAERRLEEAEKLAVQGRLNAETREEITERFDAHVRSALESTQRLDAEQKQDIASRIHSRIESAFSAHAEVLANTKAEASASVRGDVDAITKHVRARADDAMQARMKTESEIGARGQAGIEASADRMKEAAEAQIRVLTRLAERNTLEAEAQTRATTTIAEAQGLVVEGKVHMEEEVYGEAYQDFVKAFQLALRTHVFLRSQAEIGISFPEMGVVIDKDYSHESNGRGNEGGAAGGSEDGMPPKEPVACTMDAKQCPDGSYVGRSGPNCTFDPCPSEKQSEKEDKESSEDNGVELESETKAEANTSQVRTEGSSRVEIQFGF